MKKYIFVALLFFCQFVASAQCAMCKANAETSVGAGAKDLISINRGIIYMLVSPYLLVGTIAFIWWWNRRKKLKEAALEA